MAIPGTLASREGGSNPAMRTLFYRFVQSQVGSSATSNAVLTVTVPAAYYRPRGPLNVVHSSIHRRRRVNHVECVEHVEHVDHVNHAVRLKRSTCICICTMKDEVERTSTSGQPLGRAPSHSNNMGQSCWVIGQLLAAARLGISPSPDSLDSKWCVWCGCSLERRASFLAGLRPILTTWNNICWVIGQLLAAAPSSDSLDNKWMRCGWFREGRTVRHSRYYMWE
ncbi:hypothetical protein V8F33_012992 [Rhypophila sp. PSN 637]